MSNELTKARQQLSQIRTYLRTGKPLPAIQALHSTILIVLKNPLMKSEKDEFSQMLEDAVYSIMADPSVKKLYPRNISYTPGNERQLLDEVRELLETMDSDIRDAVQEAVRLREERRQKLLAEGEAFLEKGDVEKARQTFVILARENKDDSVLQGQIGEVFLKHAAYEDAIGYLEIALKMNPELVYLYNHIGIALRKTGNFATAEKYYLRAANHLGRDPNLFFNLGRLYIDWERWDKAVMAASGALKIMPGFVEAQKLRDYAEARLQKANQGRLAGE